MTARTIITRYLRPYALIWVLVVGFLLRLINLNQSLWLDEAISVLVVKNNSFLSLVAGFSPGDFHPPLYYFVLKIWDGLFGYSEVASRFPSVIFGVVTCYVVFLIGKKLLSERVGLLAAIFMAVNPLAVYYSQEARMYSLAMMAVSAAFYFFLEKKWFLYLICFLVAVYSDYLPFLLLPVFFLLSSDKKKFLILNSIVLIFYLPWLPALLFQLRNGLSAVGTSWGELLGPADWKNIILIPVKFTIGRISFDNKYFYGAVMSTTFLFYGYLLSRVKERSLWLWLTVPLFIAIIISFKVPILTYFRYLFVLPAFALLLGAGAKARLEIAAVALVSLVSILVFNVNTRFQRENWREAAVYVSNPPGVVLMPSLAQAAPLRYYSPSSSIEDTTTLSLDGKKTVYLIRYVQEIFDPTDFLKTSLENNGYHLIDSKNFNGVVIWKYQI